MRGMETAGTISPRAGVEATSLTLLERVKAHDNTAWRRLVGLYSPLVFSWCRRCGLGDEDTADTVQEVFAAVAGNLAKFRRDRPGDTFCGWLRVITRNQIRLHFRRAANRPQAVGGTDANLRIQELPDENLDDPDSVDGRERTGLFHRALDLVRCEFEERTWQAFWLTVVEEMPSAEVCQRLGMTAVAVRQAKFRVLRRLRAELGEVPGMV